MFSRIINSVFPSIQEKKKNAFQNAKLEKMREGGCFTPLTNEQKKEVEDFYLKYYGRKIDVSWHEYYLFANGEFSPKYLPTNVYYHYIYPKLNCQHSVLFYSDKNMIRKLLGDRVKLPKIYVQNINGIFYSDECVISKEKALSLCQNIDDAIIKHCLDTKQGKSILRFSSKNGNVTGKNCPQTVDELFEHYEMNFIVQGAIQQCDEMARLNPTSLNTIRVMTYWSQHNGIVPLFEVVRMGKQGSVVDNASAGGYYCGVNNDGTLKKYAYTLTPYSKQTQLENGVVFGEFKVPIFDKLLAKAVELHAQLPYTKLIGWDFAIDRDMNIEIVEINAKTPGIFQVATGPVFGKYTEEVFEYCKSVEA